MSAGHRLTHLAATVLAVLLIAVLALPGAASARPADDSAGPRSHVVERLAPAPTVVRTVIREDAVRALPIALAGAALLIAIAGTGIALVRIAPLRQQLH